MTSHCLKNFFFVISLGSSLTARAGSGCSTCGGGQDDAVTPSGKQDRSRPNSARISHSDRRFSGSQERALRNLRLMQQAPIHNTASAADTRSHHDAGILEEQPADTSHSQLHRGSIPFAESANSQMGRAGVLPLQPNLLQMQRDSSEDNNHPFGADVLSDDGESTVTSRRQSAVADDEVRRASVTASAVMDHSLGGLRRNTNTAMERLRRESSSLPTSGDGSPRQQQQPGRLGQGVIDIELEIAHNRQEVSSTGTLDLSWLTRVDFNGDDEIRENFMLDLLRSFKPSETDISASTATAATMGGAFSRHPMVRNIRLTDIHLPSGRLPDLHQFTGLIIIEASGCGIREVGTLPDSIERVDLTNNDLRQFPIEAWNRISSHIIGLLSARQFDLRPNRRTQFDDERDQYLLDLAGNQFQTLPEKVWRQLATIPTGILRVVVDKVVRDNRSVAQASADFTFSGRDLTAVGGGGGNNDDEDEDDLVTASLVHVSSVEFSTQDPDRIPLTNLQGGLYLGPQSVLNPTVFTRYNVKVSCNCANDAGVQTLHREAVAKANSMMMVSVNALQLSAVTATSVLGINLRLPDDGDNSLDFENSVMESVEAMAEALHSGEVVMINCAMGVNRSATVVILLLMLHDQKSLLDAVRIVKLARPAIHPHDPYLAKLVKIELELAKKRGQKPLEGAFGELMSQVKALLK